MVLLNNYKKSKMLKISSGIILVLLSLNLLAQNKLTLNECRQMALETNKKILMAEEHKLAATSVKKFTRTQYLPNFAANGGYMRTNKEFNLLSENIFLPVIPSEAIKNGKLNELAFLNNPSLLAETFELDGSGNIMLDENGDYIFKNYSYLPADEVKFGFKNIYSANIGMIQPIFTGGKIKQLNNLADQGEDMMQAKKQIAEHEVLYETDEYYWKVISLQEKVVLTQSYKKRIEQLIDDLNNLYQEGIITNNDLLRAKVKLSEVELKMLKASNGLQMARMALNQVIGLPVDSVVVLSDSLETNYQIPVDVDYTQMALSDRPEISLMNTTLEMAKSGEKLMKSRYMPNVGLTANYMFMNPSPYNGFKEEFGADWNIGVFVNIPLFHWGDKIHTVDAMRHERNAAELKSIETEELITLQVKQTIYKYTESVKKVELSKTALQQTEENLKLTRDNFDEGIVKATDLLEAQTMWQEAYSNLIDAKTENKLCETELLKVTGQLNK
ncbi:MAG: hypothetical protein A2X13_07830 [Bacteroidetes bacterium GWC2_33_15]|nr:MAG: hypothetical protein A2X10_04885 [Bacteroidetes bacterium GWA2_33_15]OFX52661.1 MAG: hypothetical protein A2X13_07830 [Bacteroidetes bacterium GWC2_33_15]OFX64033.1 MAG: hypothetical protein A2X15_02505 [Bacteroidetes bacterium GWB2_32_14]OFX67282.1 MAG: hypothetical protein A2X14_11910 [Bacteroidetes bacterium GWD2_33_33]